MLKHFRSIYIILCLFTTLLVSQMVFASVTTSTDTTVTQQDTKSQTPISPLPKASTDNTVKQKSKSDSPEVIALKDKLESLKLQQAIMSTQNSMQIENYKTQLLELLQEKDRLQLMNDLQAEKTQYELQQLKAAKEKVSLENELQAGKQKQLLADLEAMKARLVLENERHTQEKKKLLAKLEVEKEQLTLQNAIVEAKQNQKGLKLQMEMATMNAEMTKVELRRSKLSLEVEELIQKIKARKERKIWESEVNRPKEYLINPFVNEQLVISDRKIKLDLIIFWGTAKYVNERIDYYNNMSTEYPIFLVIDTCFGGSVTEGAKILEAIRASRAPVYVVVKTMAASMAAVITTLAKHSYAYPNAQIVHHQIMTIMFGNKKEIADEMKIMDEWTKRILYPVAKKMGITMDEFVQQMYKHNSLGDWFEFADAAAKLKWVNTIVRDIRDTSFIAYPKTKTNRRSRYFMLKSTIHDEKVDPQGQRYVDLPRLNPLDVYFLYNPNDYYRYR